MPDDVRTVDIATPVKASVAPAFAGLLVSRMLQPASVQRLVVVMDALAVEAEHRGLTDDILEAELAARRAPERATGGVIASKRQRSLALVTV